jgi:hypothetical protein
MRDIRGDLQERASMVEREIKVERARLEMLLTQLKREQDSRLEHLRAQLWAMNRLVEVATLQHKLRTAVSLAAAAIESISKEAAQTPHASDPPALH